MLYFLITIILALGYLFLQLHYLYQWLRIEELNPDENFKPALPVSIIVIAHNEKDTIGPCIESLLNQDYPKDLVDIVIVNDRSEDGTPEIVQQLSNPALRLFHLHEWPDFIHEPAYKKSGIALAVTRANHEWIVQVDADTVAHPELLKTIAFAKEKQGSKFMTAPVMIDGSDSMIVRMQETENLVIMLVTGAGIASGLHEIANGANMSFSKEAFKTAGGYTGNYHIASGDDMFLVEKMRIHYPGEISFLKSNQAVVRTAARETWADLIRQRGRWARKNEFLLNKKIQYIWAFVGAYHIAIIAALILSFLSNIYLMCMVILIITKWVADYILLSEASNFFNKREIKKYFLPLQFLYAWYIIRLGAHLMFQKNDDW